MERKTPFEQVYQYCLDNYEFGYDLIIESWTEKELRTLTDLLTVSAAKRAIDAYVLEMTTHYEEKRAAFDL
jgi:hypothetical protein